jgi:long-chain acyl-CoA synthetase
VTALVILDEDNLVEWAQRNRVEFGAYAELARSPDVKKLVEEEIATVNKTLTHVESIKRFRVLERRLDRDEGELTPTLKVRRKIIEEKYGTLIDEMYRG